MSYETTLECREAIEDLCTGAREDTPSERVARLYASPGGPLIGWLFDECRRRREDYKQLAAHLGVTYGYIYQLRSGLRRTEHISNYVAVACARYLGVPPIVVKLIAGKFGMSDFVHPQVDEPTFLDRAVERMLDDPAVRPLLPVDMSVLSLEAKRALVTMYSEVSGHDLLGLRCLPETVRWLQRAAMLHDESSGEVVRGHRDVANRGCAGEQG